MTKAFQAGLISQRTALKELRGQSEITGMWTNITNDDIEKTDDTVMQPDEGMGDMNSLLDTGGPSNRYGSEGKDNPQKDEQVPVESFPESMEDEEPNLVRTEDRRTWNEEDHPRRSDGKFGKSGGKGSTKAERVVMLLLAPEEQTGYRPEGLPISKNS